MCEFEASDSICRYVYIYLFMHAQSTATVEKGEITMLDPATHRLIAQTLDLVCCNHILGVFVNVYQALCKFVDIFLQYTVRHHFTNNVWS